MSLVVLFNVFLLLCCFKKLSIFPGYFQCFAARKVRSVVLRLIKTDEKLRRILPVRLLDGRTHYQNVLCHSFSSFFISL